MYRRLPYRYRRYPLLPFMPAPLRSPAQSNIKKGPAEQQTIPLPNEVDLPDNSTERNEARAHPFSRLFGPLHIDDLILLGLVFLLLEEGARGIEEEFLIVILIYLFIAGRM